MPGLDLCPIECLVGRHREVDKARGGRRGRQEQTDKNKIPARDTCVDHRHRPLCTLHAGICRTPLVRSELPGSSRSEYAARAQSKQPTLCRSQCQAALYDTGSTKGLSMVCAQATDSSAAIAVTATFDVHSQQRGTCPVGTWQHHYQQLVTCLPQQPHSTCAGRAHSNPTYSCSSTPSAYMLALATAPLNTQPGGA